jgi:acyl-CoA thioesterase-2
VHSLHAYFLRPGDPAVPIVYEVDRIRDGRSFTTRRVVAIQHGQAIFNLSASFHVDEPGYDHQMDVPAVPDPESLPPPPAGDEPARAIDVRPVTTDAAPGRARTWLRADGRLPDDPLLHACVVTYASDLTLLDTVLSAHGLNPHRVALSSAPGVMLASLDHAVWFHRPFRADEWLLYDQDSPVAHGARGFARGSIFTRSGGLVASVVQEGLVRPRR